MYLISTSSFSNPRLARPARSDRRPHPAGAHQRVVLRWIDITESFVEFANVNVLRAIDGSGRGHAGGRLDAAGSRNHVLPGRGTTATRYRFTSSTRRTPNRNYCRRFSHRRSLVKQPGN